MRAPGARSSLAATAAAKGAAVALAAVVALAGCGKPAPVTRSETYPVADRPAAPELSGELLDGGRYDLATRRGEVVVINFWASWCAPCRDEAVELESALERTEPAGVSFIGINVRDERDKARAFLASHKVSYPTLFDPAGRYALDFEVPPNTVPATLIVDRQGRLAAVYRKALLRDDLAAAIEKVAAER